MNKQEEKRFSELKGMKPNDRSEEEIEELAKLQAKADGHGYRKDDEDDEGMGASEVKALVHSTVVDAMGAALEGKSVSPEDIATAVEGVLGKSFDKEGLAKMVSDQIESHGQKGITVDNIDEVLTKWADKNDRSESKHYFPTGGQPDIPIEFRGGNLTVADMQLYNILAKAAPESAIEHRPEHRDEGIDSRMLKNATMRGNQMMDTARKAAKYGNKTALTTGGSGTGLELIPTDLSNELQLRLYLNSPLAARMVASEIVMPTDSFTLPLRTTRTTFTTGSENPGSNPADSSPGTSNIVLNAAKLIGITKYSYEADEDAIIAMLPFVTDNLASAAGDALEGAIINGDTTATHQDSDIHAVANHSSKLFKGLRKYANAGSTSRSLATGGISEANFLQLKKDMLRWGTQPRDLLCITGVKGYNDFLGLEKTLTAEQVGTDAARILTGSAPSLFGIPILVSSQIREDLNNAGVYDGTTTTDGSFLIIHVPSFLMGVRRTFQIEVDRDVQQQVNIVVASFRRDLQPLETPSTALPYVVMGRDYVS
jgi:HK97 family phage major capsid protein